MANEFRGDRLRALRIARGEDHIETGAAVDVDRSHISKMESGAKQPSLEVLLRLARHFNVDPNYLVGWADAAVAVEREQPGENLDERAALAAFRRLLREERRAAEAVVRDVLSSTPPDAGGRKKKDVG
jgi:transcriptional regulator with XRE-family HTH domain